MITNYFFLLRLAKELIQKLRDSALIDCFSQEKDSLILAFSSGNEEKYLEFCTQFPGTFLLFRDHFSRARKNTISFETIPPGALLSEIKFHKSDRTIRLDFEGGYIILLNFRGAKSNAFFCAGEQFVPFRKCDATVLEENKNLLSLDNTPSSPFENLEFLPHFEQISVNDPRLGKEIKNELIRRMAEPEETESEIRKIISGILYGGFRLTTERNGFKIVPESFITSGREGSSFTTAIEAATSLVKKNFAEGKFLQKKNALIKHYSAQIKSQTRWLEDLENRITLGDRSAQFERFAQILLMYPGKKEKGIKELKLPDYMSQGEILRIPLDEKLDINQNTRKYFDRSKEEKLSFEAALVKIPEIKAKISKFASDLKLIENCKSLPELSAFEHKENENKKPKTADDAVRYRAFKIEPHYIVYVGKDSKQNDELTLHFARPNDIWMHARGCPGSHTVLRDTTGRNEFGKDVIKAAASIAAYFSKARNAKYVPVAYTEKKYVVKRKGMEAGKVQMMRESIVMAVPALPKDELNSKGD